MMADVQIKADPAKLAEVHGFLSELPDKIALAERDALNKSMAHGRSVAATDLASLMTARKGDINKRLNQLKATKSRLSTTLIIRGGIGVNLIGFGARQTKAGVTARIFGQRQAFPGAFITRSVLNSAFNLGASGPEFVAKREGDKRKMTRGVYASRVILHGPRAGQPILRQPLQAQRGPTVADTWEKTPGIAEHTVNETNAAIPANLDRQVTRYLGSGLGLEE